MQIEFLTPDQIAEAARAWQTLETRAGEGALACSWDWTETWLRHFGDLVPHRFAVGLRSGTPCGIALVTERRTRMLGGLCTIRSLHLGTAGEPRGHGIWIEYNRLLVEPDARDAFAAALIAAVRHDPRWDEFILDGFAPEDAAALLQAEPGLVPTRESCWAVDLRVPGSAGREALKLFKPAIQRKVRQSLRAFGPLETEWAETPEQALDILDELMVLHQHRWRRAGKPGAFASARNVAFHREIVPRLLPKKAVLLFRARNGSGTVGCLYSFIERGTVFFYQGGLASFDDNKLRSGYVVHALCLQACLERGLEEYNFLQGDDRYKQELATVRRELIWAAADRPRPQVLVMTGLRRLKRWARHARARTSGVRVRMRRLAALKQQVPPQAQKAASGLARPRPSQPSD